MNSVETRRRSLKIVEDRYAAGYGSDSERQQAVSELANAEVTIPDLKKSIASLEASLRLLVGEGADAIWNEAPIGDLPQTLPEPPEVSWDVAPASLLDRRPDVLAAEASLKAANARIGVARAQRLPSISISAILGTSDTKWNGLFEGPSQTWTLSGNLAAPIFDFGRSRNRVKSAKAAAEAAEVNYRAVVRNAFLELRNAATAADLSRESVQARMRQDQAWTRSLTIAEERAKTGYADPLELLDAERSQMAAQLALVSARRDRLVAAVNLCRALGGGWSIPEKK
jgi:multidrug efflux system outer membrane protein